MDQQQAFFIVDQLDQLDTESRYVAHKAKEASLHAYAPYSRFLVGAAVLLEDGTVITGTNQENASYPAGMCAERVALYAAAAQHPDAIIVKIAVAARRKGGKEIVPATPCGPCRQVLLEFEARQHRPIQIVMQHHDHQWVRASSAAALLPFGFTAAALEGHDRK